MAYVQSNLYQIGGYPTGVNAWLYLTTDTFSTTQGSNYFADGQSRGMLAGDAVTVIVFTTSLKSGSFTGYSSYNLGVCSSVGSSGATIAAVSAGGGSSTLTANSTATSGFTANQLLGSDGSKLQVATAPVLGTPTSGTLTNCTGLPIAGTTGYGTGVATALAANVNGSGPISLKTSPTFVTPALGVASATSVNGLTITSSTGTLTIANDKTLAASSSMTLAAGADSQTWTFPSVSDTVACLGTAQTFSAQQTINATLQIGSTNQLQFSTDAIVARDGAGILAQRNSTNAQILRVYNTYTSSSVNEGFAIDWQTTANTARLVTFTTGGTMRELFIGSNSTTTIESVTSGNGYNFNINSQNGGAANNNVTLRIRGNGGNGYFGRVSAKFGIFDSGSNAILLFGGDVGAWNSLIQFGGSTSSFPALKRSAATLQVRLADDSADAQMTMGTLQINQTPTAVSSGSNVNITSGADGATNIGHRISINMNGTTYWIPASTTAF